MRFQAKKDDRESREYWESVRRGAKEYDELPAWKKGVLGGTAQSARPAETKDDSRKCDGK